MKHKHEIGIILSEVEKVKAHKIFNRSPLMCAFLSYVTQETLQGRESRISAYSVAVEALGKPTNFDPQMDPSVRVLAKRLRDSLARYYDEMTDYRTLVVMKPGSYIPSFYHTKPISQSAVASSVASGFNDTASSGSRIAWSTPVVFYCTEDTDSDVDSRNNEN